MAVNTYIVAVKRDQQAEAPDDWVDQIGALDGVSVTGTTGKRAQISADDDGIQRVRDTIGSYTHIEPVIEHHSR